MYIVICKKMVLSSSTMLRPLRLASVTVNDIYDRIENDDKQGYLKSIADKQE